jgi:hypothetical protein
MGKKKIKSLKPNFKHWPPLWSVTRSGNIKKVTRNDVVQGDYEFLVMVYPEMEELFDSLFSAISDDQIVRLIGKDYPAWVRAYIEKRLRNPHKDKEAL